MLYIYYYIIVILYFYNFHLLIVLNRFSPAKRPECSLPNSAYVCNPSKWKLDLPNGNYKITLMVLD